MSYTSERTKPKLEVTVYGKKCYLFLPLSFPETTQVKNLGAVLDSDLNLESHITDRAVLYYIIFTSELEWALIAHSTSECFHKC